MTSSIFNENCQLQEVDISNIFDVLEGGEDENAVKFLLGFGPDDPGIDPGNIIMSPCNKNGSTDLITPVYSSSEETPSSTFLLDSYGGETGVEIVTSSHSASIDHHRSTLTGGRIREISDSKSIYICDSCSKRFTTKFNLKRHINMHCHRSKEAGIPLQGPPSAHHPSRKSSSLSNSASSKNMLKITSNNAPPSVVQPYFQPPNKNITVPVSSNFAIGTLDSCVDTSVSTGKKDVESLVKEPEVTLQIQLHTNLNNTCLSNNMANSQPIETASCIATPQFPQEPLPLFLTVPISTSGEVSTSITVDRFNAGSALLNAGYVVESNSVSSEQKSLPNTKPDSASCLTLPVAIKSMPPVVNTDLRSYSCSEIEEDDDEECSEFSSTEEFESGISEQNSPPQVIPCDSSPTQLQPLSPPTVNSTDLLNNISLQPLQRIPNSWLRKVIKVNGGIRRVFYYNPSGKKFSNQTEINQYFKRVGYSVDESLFDFEVSASPNGGMYNICMNLSDGEDDSEVVSSSTLKNNLDNKLTSSVINGNSILAG